MPETLTLKDGTFTTLFSERDFEELIDKYMGFDAARYFRDHFGAPSGHAYPLGRGDAAKYSGLGACGKS